MSNSAVRSFEPYSPNYHLLPEEMSAIERELIGQYKASGEAQAESVAAFVLQHDDPFADFARTIETATYEDYDSALAMRTYEQSSFFVLTADMQADRIAHVKRVVAANPTLGLPGENLTGLEVIDDRIKAVDPNEHASLEELLVAHEIDDVMRGWNLTSNSAVPGVMPSKENPFALLSYKAIYQLTRIEDMDFILAYLNEGARKSLGKLGVVSQLLGDREFHLPSPPNSTTYDEHYTAVVIPNVPENTDAFTRVNPDKPLTRLVADRIVPVIETQVVADGDRVFLDRTPQQA
jgi:hypothetical protein